jgi:perosamine synthetase
MDSFIPYGRQCIDDDDIQSVVDVLKSDFITTGPMIDKFEEAVAEFSNTDFGVAVSNGTAALHAMMAAAGISKGDEVIATPMTFAATSNAVIYQGGTPVFADVKADSLLIDPDEVIKKITSRTKAVIAVDYAGQPCDYDALREITNKHGLLLLSDACHSIGSEYKKRKTGSIADMTAFSFHPVKHITTGEGGMLLTNNPEFARKAKAFRGHGITTDYRQREKMGNWHYDMVSLGYNYRITDFQCALGISQLKKLSGWIKRRQEIAGLYAKAFKNCASVNPLSNSPDVSNAYHLYVIKLSENLDRGEVFSKLRESKIGVNVHYIPVHLHPYYRENLGTTEGMCPIAEAAYEKIISIPMFPTMSNADVDRVVSTLLKITGES